MLFSPTMFLPHLLGISFPLIPALPPAFQSSPNPSPQPVQHGVSLVTSCSHARSLPANLSPGPLPFFPPALALLDTEWPSYPPLPQAHPTSLTPAHRGQGEFHITYLPLPLPLIRPSPQNLQRLPCGLE